MRLSRINQACANRSYSGERLSPRSSLRLALPILAGKPRNAPMPAHAGILRGRRPGPPLRRLGSAARPPFAAGETAAVSALTPPPPIRRPGATIRRDRFPPQAADATPAAYRAPPCADSPCASLRSLRSTSRPPRRLRPFAKFGRSVAAGLRGSLSLPRSRILSQRSLSPVGCLIIAPATAGGPAARAPRPVRASRYCSPSLRSTLR